MLGSLADLLPARSRCVLVDGPADQAELFAARLAEKLSAGRRPVQVTLDANGSGDVAIFLRTTPGGRHFPVYRKDAEDPGDGASDGPKDGNGPKDGKERGDHGRREREERADIVIDLHDVHWPVIRRVVAPLAARGAWYVTETRAFFACRAATWDAKFGDDLPAYCAAVTEAGIRHGGVVVDIGCGTGRALPALRMAVGPSGAVVALDITPEMLAVARPAATLAAASLVLADARALPFPAGSLDAIFAAGLVNHLPDTEAGLRELARVTRPGGLLVLFHPSGRAALAARHGHALSPDEPLAEGPLRRSTAAAGWAVTAYDDAPHRFFAVATRTPATATA
jgi:2-polyprenyl-3-methyl-5-hydroxy-6-metoxy-1,4-benzoquinol methylase